MYGGLLLLITIQMYAFCPTGVMYVKMLYKCQHIAASLHVYPGGTLRYQMVTHCQTPLRAKKGAVNFKSKQLMRVVACKMCLFSLYFVKYIMFIT